MISLEDIPNELLINIINFLTTLDIISLSQVNKKFNLITKENNYCIFDNKKYYQIIEFIKHCKKITYFEDLSLNFKYYINELPQLLNNNLKTINIRASDKYELSFIKHNKDVKNLKLKCFLNLEDDYILDLFDSLNKIKNLGIYNTVIDDRLIGKINKYTLNSLSLEACINLKNISLINQNKLKKLEIISFNRVEEIIKLLKKQTKLEILNLSFSDVNLFTTSIITENNISNNLKILNLSYSQGIIDDLSAFMIGNNCKNLKELYLNDTSITNHGVYFIVRGCKKIEKLGLAASLIKDYALVEIANYYPKIISLHLEFNNITRIGVYNLLLRCKNLSYLNIMNDNFNIKYLQYVYNNAFYL